VLDGMNSVVEFVRENPDLRRRDSRHRRNRHDHDVLREKPKLARRRLEMDEMPMRGTSPHRVELKITPSTEFCHWHKVANQATRQCSSFVACS